MTIDKEIALLHYKSMIQACYCERSAKYPKVGGRGIGVCKRWRQSFANFLQDMGTPKLGQTLQRKNLDGPFELSNVQWQWEDSNVWR